MNTNGEWKETDCASWKAFLCHRQNILDTETSTTEPVTSIASSTESTTYDYSGKCHFDKGQIKVLCPVQQPGSHWNKYSTFSFVGVEPL